MLTHHDLAKNRADTLQTHGQLQGLLMIPHAPQVQIRTRMMDLSKAIAEIGTEVDIYLRNTQPSGLSLRQKVQWHIAELSLGYQVRPLAPKLRSVKLSTMHRGRRLMQLSDKLGASYLGTKAYRTIITSAYCGMLFKPNQQQQLIYDLVDDHADGYRVAGEPEIASQVETFMAQQIQHANRVIASGKVLVEFAQNRYNREALYVPNGADVTTIHQALKQNPHKGMSSKRSKLRIGYIGGLENFVRIDLVVNAIQELRRRGIDAELIVVGQGPAIQQLPCLPWLTLMGFKPPDQIPAIVSTFDIGILPFEISSFTDAALPLKIIEYGAARCLAIASPIRELQLQQFPWVSLAPLAVKDWVETLIQLSSKTWDTRWDATVAQFDWRKIAQMLLQSIE